MSAVTMADFSSFQRQEQQALRVHVTRHLRHTCPLRPGALTSKVDLRLPSAPHNSLQLSLARPSCIILALYPAATSDLACLDVFRENSLY